MILSGQNFAGPVQVKLGSQLATNPAVSSFSQLQITSPPSVVNGAVNLTAYFQSSWLGLAPDAFSYGPQVLQVLPNSGANPGGDSIPIYGYGFGTDPTKITVNIGSPLPRRQFNPLRSLKSPALPERHFFKESVSLDAAITAN